MTVSNLLVPNIFNSFNLALFVCHLFIDGNFKTGYIVHDSNRFDFGFISEIESVCAVSIPWLTVDITEPATPIEHQSERNDYILQLIFLDPKHLPKQINDSKKHFTYYRIFVFSSTDETEMKNIISVIQKLGSVLDSSTLALYCTPNNIVNWIGINSDETMRNLNENGKAVFVKNQNANYKSEHLFDRTFGESEQMWTLATRLTGLETTIRGQKRLLFKNSEVYVANLFFSTVNLKYINLTCISYAQRICPWNYRASILTEKKYYQELSDEYKLVSSENL